ncbi:hypothetical protein EYF80_015377 [Liparis tanakae]|uniref:Uncharacterized protein n=1 Tax=Liparis tanakae TaxID=230148 RepID=A0A4Z2I8Y3_9TELE|nr:hypothetical protein EYF80_015377 [Liparis tanakae]
MIHSMNLVSVRSHKQDVLMNGYFAPTASRGQCDLVAHSDGATSPPEVKTMEHNLISISEVSSSTLIACQAQEGGSTRADDRTAKLHDVRLKQRDEARRPNCLRAVGSIPGRGGPSVWSLHVLGSSNPKEGGCHMLQRL